MFKSFNYKRCTAIVAQKNVRKQTPKNDKLDMSLLKFKKRKTTISPAIFVD